MTTRHGPFPPPFIKELPRSEKLLHDTRCNRCAQRLVLLISFAVFRRWRQWYAADSGHRLPAYNPDNAVDSLHFEFREEPESVFLNLFRDQEAESDLLLLLVGIPDRCITPSDRAGEEGIVSIRFAW